MTDRRPREPLSRVQPEWVDHYGHMNLAYYLVVFDAATDRLWPQLGLGPALRERGFGTFTAESWIDYKREVTLDAPLDCESAVLCSDAKRLILHHRMFHADEGWVAAEAELLFLCINLARRKVTEWPPTIADALAQAATGGAPQRLSLTRGRKPA